MHPTSYPHVNSLLNELFLRIRKVLVDKLVGLYLGGSLVLGDFSEQISDIDLVAALSSDITDTELNELRQMHADFVDEHKEWQDRIEVCYISRDALKTVKSRASQIVNISPGEPIHRLESTKDWIMNWYLTREYNIPLFGPHPKTIIEPISKEEYIQSVKDHMKSWDTRVKNMCDRYAQAAYVILTTCRALYTYKNGDQVSKIQAARWAKRELPEWSNLIGRAIVWRETRNEERVDDAMYRAIVQFMDVVRGQIGATIARWKGR